jgi:hypothetical protein
MDKIETRTTKSTSTAPINFIIISMDEIKKFVNLLARKMYRK